MDTGYLMEGEPRGYERERMKFLAEGLDSFLKAHPEITLDGPLMHFAMHAVRRLANAFVFNDSIGADQPDFKERLVERIVEDAGGPEQFAEKIKHVDDDTKH